MPAKSLPALVEWALDEAQLGAERLHDSPPHGFTGGLVRVRRKAGPAGWRDDPWRLKREQHPAMMAGQLRVMAGHDGGGVRQVDGTLVQRRWTEAAVAVKFEQLQPVAAYPSGARSAMGAGLVVVGHHRVARHARLAGYVHTPAPVDDAGGAGAGGPASSAVAAYWQRSS